MASTPASSPAAYGIPVPHAPAHGSVEHVRTAFDAMAGEYDDLRAPYYRHSLAVIDRILQREAGPAPSRGRALDVGCGTGIQSLRLARLGYRVLGVDIASRLLDVARDKLAAAGCSCAVFVEADAASIPAPDSAFDFVSCCSSLSMMWRWRDSLREMARCLRPGGKLLLEVDGKWNLDMAWEVLSALAGNAFGYDQPLGRALRNLMPPWRTGHRIEYSLKLEAGGAVPLWLKLFTAAELARELDRVGLRPRRRWGIHSVTNVIPSTVLHRPDGGGWRRRAFESLAALERRLTRLWPLNALGCSLVVLAEKDGRASP